MVDPIEQNSKQHRAAVLETCRHAPQFVPVIYYGVLMAINRHSLDTIMPDPDITVEDYVVGLELLGEHFYAVREAGGCVKVLHSVQISLPEDRREAWERWAERLRAVWDASRNSEILTYLIARDVPPRPEVVTIGGEPMLDLRRREASR